MDDYPEGAYLMPNDRDLPYELQVDDEAEPHLLTGRILGVYDRKQRNIWTRVANHGVETCSCGWSSGEQISLPEASRISNRDHPQGRRDHKGY